MCLALLAIYNTLAFGQGIAVSPSRIFFEGAPGQTVSQRITFTNSSSQDFDFVAGMKDWNRDSLGRKEYFQPGSLAESNASWLQLSQNAVELKAGETKAINLSVTIPNDSAQKLQTRSMIFFTQVKKAEENTKPGLNVNVLLEIGIQVYHTPPALTAGELEFVSFEDLGQVQLAEQPQRQVDVKIKNTGQINKDAYVRLELTNMQTGEEVPVQAVTIAMHPQAAQHVRFTLPPDLAAGKYLAVAILDAGSQYDLKIAEKEITY